MILFDMSEYMPDNFKNMQNPFEPAVRPQYTNITVDAYHTMLKRYRWITDNIGDSLPVGRDAPLMHALQDMIAASEDPQLGFGPMSEQEGRCLNWCFDRIAIDSGQLLDKVSTRFYSNTASDGEFGEALVEGGFYQMFQHMIDEEAASPAGALDIRLNSVVKSVVEVINEEGAREVQITCTNGEVFFADAVVCTAPLGVLKADHIQFTPRPRQLDALCEMDMGLMNLVWVWYPRKFWPEGYNFLGVSRKDSAEPTFSTLLVPPMKDQYGREAAIVMCQTVGQFGRDVEQMTDAEAAGHATELLRDIFGEDVPDAIGCSHSAWGCEPFSLGSYSCIGVSNKDFPNKDADTSAECCLGSCSPTSVAATTTDEDPPTPIVATVELNSLVYFAGEATHRMHQGTAHGAYISGIREATKLLADRGVLHRWEESCFLNQDIEQDFSER